MTSKTALTLSLCALVLAPGLAHAAEPPCLTAPEFTAIATYALPGVIDGLAERCKATLSASAFLPSGAVALSQRYAPARAASWPQAKAAFLKLSAGAGGQMAMMLAMMPDDNLQQFVDTLAGQVASQKVPAEDCGRADDLTRLLSPLPAENVAGLLAIAASRPGKDGKSPVGKFSICPSATAAPAPEPAKP